MGGGSELDLEEQEHAFECAVDAGVFRRKDSGEVLIVEDDPVIAAKLLRDAGHDEGVVQRIVAILQSPPAEEE